MGIHHRRRHRTARLTTHPARKRIRPFLPMENYCLSANYEGPTEVYTIPAAGGLPTRRTFEGGNARVIGWTPDGKVISI